MFFTASLAEANRLPFDLAECEQELIGGWHTEYSALKWALFFLGEYTHMITISFLTSILFLGGWNLPFIAEATSNYPGVWLVKLLVLFGKAFSFICLMIMLRWTIPRFRFDQLMELAWKVMIPLSLANLVMVMFCMQFGFNRWWLFVGSLGLFAAWGVISANLREAELAARPRISSKAIQDLIVFVRCANAITGRTVLVHTAAQRRSNSLTCHFNQSERADPEHSRSCSVSHDCITQSSLNSTTMAFFTHVDKVVHDDTAQVTQTNLASNRIGRLQVHLIRTLFSVVIGSEASTIDVNGNKGFRLINHE
jgi:hypothetical protein